jgi:hypothetical protein
MDSPSASGSINLHDWRRIGELFVQGLVTFLVTWILSMIPQIDFGQWAPIGTIATLVLTEVAKRYAQGPTQ